MKRGPKPDRKYMELGKTVAFRPSSAELVEMFNMALDVTGADLKELCQLAIQRGLQAATSELKAQREAEERRRKEAERRWAAATRTPPEGR